MVENAMEINRYYHDKILCDVEGSGVVSVFCNDDNEKCTKDGWMESVPSIPKLARQIRNSDSHIVIDYFSIAMCQISSPQNKPIQSDSMHLLFFFSFPKSALKSKY